MDSNQAATVEEESEDQATCCICLEFYDEGERKPKFLSCHHTYCLKCIKVRIKNSYLMFTNLFV